MAIARDLRWPIVVGAVSVRGTLTIDSGGWHRLEPSVFSKFGARVLMGRLSEEGFHLDAFDVVRNPRLTDVLGIQVSQADVDFAIPRLKADLPFAVDPFLLWKSDKLAYRELHGELLRFLQHIRGLALSGRATAATSDLLGCQEPRMAGLGYAVGSKAGSTIGPSLASDITSVFATVPQLADEGLTHLEILGLLVPNIAEDRISDITIAVLLDFFITFTMERALALNIPTRRSQLPGVWDSDRKLWKPKPADLPYNPYDDSPLLFVPLDLIRHLPWINYESYYHSPFASLVLPPEAAKQRISKGEVLRRNREHFIAVEAYVSEREDQSAKCTPAPIVDPTPLRTLRRQIRELDVLPTGKDDGVAQKYEKIASSVLRTVLWPDLEFAEAQSGTASRVSIRDVVFFNPATTTFTNELRKRHEAWLIPFEMKNVAKLDGDHVDQISRYLDNFTGRLGVICSRREPPPSVIRNIIDLHSSKQNVVLWLTDTDLTTMVETFASGGSAMTLLRSRYAKFLNLLPK